MISITSKLSENLPRNTTRLIHVMHGSHSNISNAFEESGLAFGLAMQIFRCFVVFIHLIIRYVRFVPLCSASRFIVCCRIYELQIIAFKNQTRIALLLYHFLRLHFHEVLLCPPVPKSHPRGVVPGLPCHLAQSRQPWTHPNQTWS